MKEGVLLVLLLAASASALVCMTCEEDNLELCQRRGRLGQCSNQQVCFIMVRKENKKQRITKGCKQANACNNLLLENKIADRNGERCNSSPTSLCSCCCNKNRCNDGMETCNGGNYGSENMMNLNINKIRRPRPSTVYPSSSKSSATCPSLGTMYQGYHRCNRGYSVGSRCNFYCNRGYEVYPAYRASMLCKMNRQWTKEKPCCARPCKSTAKFNMFGLAHASTNETYHKIYNVFSLIFAAWTSDVRHAHLDYSGDVNGASVLNFRESLMRSHHPTKPHIHINTPDGQSNMGKALKYASEYIRKKTKGYQMGQTDVIVIATDTDTTDLNNTLVAAREWRSKGALIYALAMKTEGRMDCDLTEMAEITGSADQVFVFNDSNMRMSRDMVIMKLMDHLCPNPCASEA